MKRDLVNKKCPSCGLPVYADQGYYSIDMSHWTCHEKEVQALDKAIGKVKELVGKPKVKRRPRGCGGPTLKLKELAASALKDFYSATTVTDVEIYVNPPVWNHSRFDVTRFQGSALVDGLLRTFTSWHTVSKLVKAKRLKCVSSKVTCSGDLELVAFTEPELS